MIALIPRKFLGISELTAQVEICCCPRSGLSNGTKLDANIEKHISRFFPPANPGIRYPPRTLSGQKKLTKVTIEVVEFRVSDTKLCT